MDRFDPGPRAKVLATILFHSTCAISVTLVSKSALNGIDAPVVLLAFQTTVQVVLLTVVGMMMGWVKLWRPLSVSENPSMQCSFPERDVYRLRGINRYLEVS